MNSFDLKQWFKKVDGSLFSTTQDVLPQGLHYRLYNQFETILHYVIDTELICAIGEL